MSLAPLRALYIYLKNYESDTSVLISRVTAYFQVLPNQKYVNFGLLIL